MPDTDNDYKAELIRGNAEGEIWGVREHQTCVLCGKEKAVEIPGYTDELRTHTMEYDKDEGHGTGMHAYRYKCTVCNWSEVRFVVCSGPPCANAMEKVPVDEEAKLEENDELEVSDS